MFNAVFFPLYFKTAYNYGVPTIVATVIAVLFAMGIEVLVMFNKTAAYYLEGKSSEARTLQIVIFLAGVVIFAAANFLAYRKSADRIEKIDL